MFRYYKFRDRTFSYSDDQVSYWLDYLSSICVMLTIVKRLQGHLKDWARSFQFQFQLLNQNHIGLDTWRQTDTNTNKESCYFYIRIRFILATSYNSIFVKYLYICRAWLASPNYFSSKLAGQYFFFILLYLFPNVGRVKELRIIICPIKCTPFVGVKSRTREQY